MNKKLLILAIVIIFLFVVGCQTNSEKYEVIEGEWTLTHYDWQGKESSSHKLFMDVNEDDVIIKEQGVEICRCKLLDEYLFPSQNPDYIKYATPLNNTDIVLFLDCGEDGLVHSARLIYIYNNSYMQSELPLAESSGRSILRR